ncbi:hypothetical protein HRG_006883 [Hirsutella rhossiliensis]|uniref:Uncharacterized protein n=1 Tax=Hirsutella rhossiliensis TaxID=111463 RepID=A0A9P8SGA2_9HYPO|nr:uncharacterized protein HRG_06883 [Hirsutella rhossiliensis]KAH0961803.1 hypothetical protein HRG_06883 [Hirsutella rhossiliensis]
MDDTESSSEDQREPYELILKSHDDNVYDLDFDTTHTKVIGLPEKPLPPTNSFVNNEHRTIAHVYGAVEERNMREEAADELCKREMTAVAAPDPSNRWCPTRERLEHCGHLLDDVITGHVLIIDQEDTRDLLPEIGQEVWIYLDVPRTQRVPPSLPRDQIRGVASTLRQKLKFAQCCAQKAL